MIFAANSFPSCSFGTVVRTISIVPKLERGHPARSSTDNKSPLNILAPVSRPSASCNRLNKQGSKLAEERAGSRAPKKGGQDARAPSYPRNALLKGQSSA